MKLGNWNTDRGDKIVQRPTMIEVQSMIEIPSIDRDTN